ncbi:MAG: EVE domain-containing protein [Candidatus Binatia bacterium]
MARCWLLKTEPTSYSYAQLEKDERTTWDGVRNPVALKHLAAMRSGDEAYVYHTGDEKAVVGLARVLSDPVQDRRVADPRMMTVDLAPGRRLKRPVTLKEVKANAALRDFDLTRQPRLSVMPVSREQRDEIERMAKS